MTSTSEPAEARSARKGIVRLSGRVLEDDSGRFSALGASMMWAAWAYKFDRPRLERNLKFLADHGFDYVRALGVVGAPHASDSWDGREIDWRWPDYADVIAGVTDLAFDAYGLRVQWTIIADGQVSIPREEDRRTLLRTFIDITRGRPQKVMLLEVANEAWKNGFEGAKGVEQLRALTRELREGVRQAGAPVLVAASAPHGSTCADWLRVYGGDVADVATIHFERSTTGPRGHWGPVLEPAKAMGCSGLPVVSNNEPVGPGSTGTTENDPARLVAAAVATYSSGAPFFVYHSRAGVRGREDYRDMPNGVAIGEAFRAMKTYLPPELPNWDHRTPADGAAPLTLTGADEARGPDGAALRVFVSTRDAQLVMMPVALAPGAKLRALANVAIQVSDPGSGRRVMEQSVRSGTVVDLPPGPVYVIAATTQR